MSKYLTKLEDHGAYEEYAKILNQAKKEFAEDALEPWAGSVRPMDTIASPRYMELGETFTFGKHKEQTLEWTILNARRYALWGVSVGAIEISPLAEQLLQDSDIKLNERIKTG